MKTAILKSLLISVISPAVWAASDAPVVDVYKSPTCGCCGKWVAHLKANGFKVRNHDTNDVVAHKMRLGVPYGYGSCHTAEVDGYVVEGHVPAREIKQMLKDKPSARGLVLPGMVAGSPGMEVDGRKVAYDVFLVSRDGSTQTYARY